MTQGFETLLFSKTTLIASDIHRFRNPNKPLSWGSEGEESSDFGPSAQTNVTDLIDIDAKIINFAHGDAEPLLRGKIWVAWKKVLWNHDSESVYRDSRNYQGNIFI